MYDGLEELASQRRVEIDRAIAEAKAAKSDAEAQAILLQAIGEVRDAVSGIAIESVTVENLDEVQAALHNELTKVSKPIIAAIEKLNISKERAEKLKAEIDSKNRNALRETHDIQIIRKPKQRFVVENLGDIAFPESLKITNFEDLKNYFSGLEECIKNLYDFEIPAPHVTVNPPAINIPEIKLPDQAVNIDLSRVIDALDPLKFLSDRPNKPIAVRLSDGSKFIQTLRTLIDNQEKQMAAFSGGLTESSARKAFRSANQPVLGGVGSKELTSAGTAAAITSSSLPCRYVDISTNAGLANVGTSGAVQTSDAEVGVTIYPGNLPYRVYTDNVNKVHAAGATGTRLSWTYYV